MMEGWKEIKLKELVSEMGDGGTPSTLNEGNFGGDIPWVVVDDVKPEIYSTKDSLTEQGYKSCSAKMWDVGTIILTTGATIGKVGIAKVPLCTKQGITGIVCNEYANNLFIRYWLEANEEQLIRYAQGTTFKEIRTRPLGNLKILIPNPFTKESVNEQSAIAAILSKVDEAIASVQASISASERLKKSLMQNLLTGRMKPDGTLRKEDEFYVDEKFGRVPVGWKVKAIGDKDVCKINPVYKYKKKEVYDFIPMEAIKENFEGVDYVEKQVIDNGSYTRFKAGDILFAKITPCSENGKVAYIDHIDSEVGFASTEFIVFHPTENVDGKFVYLLLSSGNVHRLAISLMEGTTGRQRIPWKIFRNRIFVPMPDKVEQTIIVDKILAFDKQIKDNNNKIAVLERLKKSLMQNLLTGKVRVKK